MSRIKIEGQISDIIFRNELNGYTVAILSNYEEEVTIVGYLPTVMEGEELVVEGNYETHKNYGWQFKVDAFVKEMPNSLASLERYLGNGIIKGIGPSTARKIVKKFGEDTVKIFKTEPEKLSQIKGISKEKAIQIAENFNKNWDMWRIVIYLSNLGIGVANGRRVYEALGSNAIEKIEENPYVLMDVARGVNFSQIDDYARQNGFEKDNDKRIAAGVKYALIKISYNGHCCCLKQNLIKYVKDLLEAQTEEIEDCLINLNVKKEIYIEKRKAKTSKNENNPKKDGRNPEEEENQPEEQEWVYPKELYEGEVNIANKIEGLIEARNVKEMKHFEKEIERAEKAEGIELSEMQKEAINAVNSNNVVIITGGPGTGKTTIIKTIMDIYKKHNKKCVLCAPTGRAAKRMSEATGEEAKTLHRMLEIEKVDDNARMYSMNNPVTPIDADVVIVDEASMVDIYLMNYLMNGLYKGTKLILVGDVDQLPSVGPGSILKDLINSEKLETIFLDEIFRQAAKSQIIVNAHRVNDGEYFIDKVNNKNESSHDDTSYDEKMQEESDEASEENEGNIVNEENGGNKDKKAELKKLDFFYIKAKDENIMLNTVISLCKGRLKKFGNYDFWDNIQIITPTKKGLLGTRELNKKLQEELNPKTKDKEERKFGEIVYREGDRVMQIKNNYDISWEKANFKYSDEMSGKGIFNGELGRISKIDAKKKEIEINFDDGKYAWYDYPDLEQIEHSYAITVHKSQGSEFDVVIMMAPNASPMLLTRNLLYTGMTRAKKLLIVIGNDNIIRYMINNVDTKIRNTGLEYKLRKVCK